MMYCPSSYLSANQGPPPEVRNIRHCAFCSRELEDPPSWQHLIEDVCSFECALGLILKREAALAMVRCSAGADDAVWSRDREERVQVLGAQPRSTPSNSPSWRSTWAASSTGTGYSPEKQASQKPCFIEASTWRRASSER